MNIQDALKETGKARKEDNEARYATLIQDEDADGRENLVWEGEKDELVHYTDIMEGDWQPYHEEAEIMPEDEKELWESPSGAFFLTYRKAGILYFGTDKVSHKCFNNDDIVGPLTEWTRLYPPVEEDVERIEIEGVEFMHYKEELSIIGIESFSDLAYKMCRQSQSMKMILEIPKDKP